METEQNMYRNNSLIGMKAELIDGIHVQVTGRNIIMEGRLDSKGKVNGRQAFSMGTDMNGDTIVKGLTDDTISVEKLWDERYWNDFDVDDLENADAVVVNGRAYPALKVTSSDNFDDSTKNLIVESTVEDEDGERKPVKFPAYAVSHVLELKEDVVSPAKEPGLYRDSGGSLWLNCCSFIVQLRPSRTESFKYEAVMPGRAIDPSAFPFIRISDTQGNVTDEWKERHPDSPAALH